MAHIPIQQEQIDRVKGLARDIAFQVHGFLSDYSSVSIERTVLRLYGVDGIDKDGMPLPNRIVDMFGRTNLLENGVSRNFAAAMVLSQADPLTTAERIEKGDIPLHDVHTCVVEEVQKKERELAQRAVRVLDESHRRKEKKAETYGLPDQPWKYIIVATGNVYEDVTHARSAVHSGADIIAQIRSTAQSLLDYIPYGPTTEGFGGTFATQANFKIMREALDEESEKHGRFIRLVNYSSGLCMAEIAACAAFEDLDILLNDSMYGILFRDINMKRTFVDQHFSRLICARAGIIINTGEDNYLTTSDAIENAHTVTASQLINEAMAKRALLSDNLLGLGHAFEIDPHVENAFLYEIAHAQLARQLFPHSPVKYMPPTRYKSTDIFYSHSLDTLFNLASIATKQGIHLAGILTEAIQNPYLHDRYLALSNINFVFHVAKDLGEEIQFKRHGFICKRAQKVLDEAEDFLKDVKETGLMEAITAGKFADISRPVQGGKGLEGVFKKGPDYSNPIMDLLEKKSPQ